jgi:hypothetical protein
MGRTVTLRQRFWHAPRSLPVLLTIAGLSASGFRTPLADKPAFGRLPED